MPKDIFDKIKNKYKSSKHSVYWEIYRHVFSGFDLEEKVNILEIGVDRGDGMLQFKELFPNCNICGMDIREETPHSSVGNVWIGSQTNTELLSEIDKVEGPFDIIIDDGSHMNEHQILTFEYLFPKLKTGGLYIVEDIHTSYWSYHGGGYGSNSFVEYSKKLSDMINYESWIRGFLPPDSDQFFANKDDIESYMAYNIKEEIYKNLNCISFYPNIIVLYKSKTESEYQFKCI